MTSNNEQPAKFVITVIKQEEIEGASIVYTD